MVSEQGTAAQPSWSDEELEQLRAETDLVRSGRLHFNNAGASPPPDPVVAVVRDYLDLETRRGGYETAAAETESLRQVYDDVAELLGARSRNVALVQNATVAYAQALASIDFGRGDRIVTTRNDYVSNQLMFRVLERRRGIEVVVVADLPEGGVDPQAVDDALARGGAGLVSVSWIPTNSGLIQDAVAVGAVCERRGVPYLVDGCQAVGQLPVDVAALRCDFFAATGRKYLRGPRGTGLLFVADRQLERGAHPWSLDLHGADWTAENRFELNADASRFETWEQSQALLRGVGAAARYALNVGVERASCRARSLAARLRKAVGDLDGVRCVDRGAELGAIVALAFDRADPDRLLGQLRERRMHTSVTERSSAVIEFDALGLGSTLRASPHYFNTEQEVDAFVEALGELTTS